MNLWNNPSTIANLSLQKAISFFLYLSSLWGVCHIQRQCHCHQRCRRTRQDGEGAGGHYEAPWPQQSERASSSLATATKRRRIGDRPIKLCHRQGTRSRHQCEDLPTPSSPSSSSSSAAAAHIRAVIGSSNESTRAMLEAKDRKVDTLYNHVAKIRDGDGIGVRVRHWGVKSSMVTR